MLHHADKTDIETLDGKATNGPDDLDIGSRGVPWRDVEPQFCPAPLHRRVAPPGDGAESGRSPPASGRVLLDIPLLQGSSTSHDDGAQRACFPESNTFGWRGSTST